MLLQNSLQSFVLFIRKIVPVGQQRPAQPFQFTVFARLLFCFLFENLLRFLVGFIFDIGKDFFCGIPVRSEGVL